MALKGCEALDGIPVRPSMVTPAPRKGRMCVAADLEGVPVVIVYDIQQEAGE